MPDPTLKSLTLVGFRGASEPFTLTLDPKKKLTILYGENGTGKTSVCDAFDFLANGKAGSLDDRGLGGNLDKFVVAADRTKTEVFVSLETQDGRTCTRGIGPGMGPSPAESTPRVAVLRRSQLTKLLESPPAKRYEAIATFIDVSGIEASEKALGRQIRDIKQSRENAIGLIGAKKQSIADKWEAAGRPGPDAIGWAEAQASRNNTDSAAERAALQQIESAYSSLARYTERMSIATSALEDAEAAVAKAEKAFSNAAETASAGTAETVKVLRSAQQYLASNGNPDACPLCESTEKTADLADRVNQRLDAFAAIDTAQRDRGTAARGLSQARKSTESAATDYANDAAIFNEVRSKHHWPEDAAATDHPAPEALESLDVWLASTAQHPNAWRNAEARRREESEVVAALRSALKDLNSEVEKQRELDGLIPRLERTQQIVSEERKAFTDTTLANISTEVGRLYEALHPGEGLDKISLSLHPDRRASLAIASSFQDEQAPPAAYLSESHLDTLGLCIFLALSTVGDPGATILILDDVIASVDEPHVDRVVRMFYDEGNKFRHCLMTTHYGPWRAKFKWGLLADGQAHFVELKADSNQPGRITTVAATPETDRLREMLDAAEPDIQSICATAGVVLEACCYFLSIRYACKVPHRVDGRLTLGDLLPSIDKKLKKALAVEIRQPDGETFDRNELGPILTELAKLMAVRNIQGCHYNSLAAELGPRSAIDFAELTHRFASLLVCPDAGWPRSDRSGSHWSTPGDTRRLHPLKQPG